MLCPTKRLLPLRKSLYMFVLHCGIPDIIQCDNCSHSSFRSIRYQNDQWSTADTRTCRLKGKLRKWIEATGNPRWSGNLIRVALAMNTEGHSSLPYYMTLNEVFFSRKYQHRGNNLTTPAANVTRDRDPVQAFLTSSSSLIRAFSIRSACASRLIFVSESPKS